MLTKDTTTHHICYKLEFALLHRAKVLQKETPFFAHNIILTKLTHSIYVFIYF